jgi:hypothetical protein
MWGAQAFSFFSSETKSLLDSDDLNGPGNFDFPKPTGDLAMDYAIFKIAKYSESESPLDHRRFARSLGETAQQLGPRAAEYLAPLFQSLVSPT